MLILPASPHMITAADADAVTGSFEIAEPRRRKPLPEPDPGDTVRLPISERWIRSWPMARA
jgi:hypothetical protein